MPFESNLGLVSDSFRKREAVSPSSYFNYVSSVRWRGFVLAERSLKTTPSLLYQSRPITIRGTAAFSVKGLNVSLFCFFLLLPKDWKGSEQNPLCLVTGHQSANILSGKWHKEPFVSCKQHSDPPCYYVLVCANTGWVVFDPALHIIRHVTLMDSHLSRVHAATIYRPDLQLGWI